MVALLGEVAFLYEGPVKGNAVLDEPIAVAQEPVAAGGPVRRGIDEAYPPVTTGNKIAYRIHGTGVYIAAHAVEFFVDRFADEIDNGYTGVNKLVDVRRVAGFAAYGNNEPVHPVALQGEQELLLTSEAFMAL